MKSYYICVFLLLPFLAEGGVLRQQEKCVNVENENFCGKLEPFECYSYSGSCCETCQRFSTQQSDCEFGDKMPWCSSYVKGVEECLRPEVADFCCKSCKNIQNMTNPPQSSTTKSLESTTTSQDFSGNEKPQWEECPDKEDESFCSDIKSLDCYSYKERCCHTCKNHFVPQADCVFGDRVPWCSSYVKGPGECVRTEVAYLCCQTCQKYPSTNNNTTTTSTTHSPVSTSTKQTITSSIPIQKISSHFFSIFSSDETTTSPFLTSITTTPESTITTIQSTVTTFETTATTQIVEISLSTISTTNQSNISTTKSVIDELICSDGEDESFCSNLMSFDCYNYKNQCCHSCKKYFFNQQPDCEFGDKMPWCSSYVKGVEECLRPEVADFCCKSCKNIQNMTNPPQSSTTKSLESTTTSQDFSGNEKPQWEECLDKEDESFCSDIKSLDCYSYKERCCHTCKNHFVPQAGCVFGDRVPWCSSYVKGPGECVRTEVAYLCCQTCQKYPSTNNNTTTTSTTHSPVSTSTKQTITSSIPIQKISSHFFSIFSSDETTTSPFLTSITTTPESTITTTQSTVTTFKTTTTTTKSTIFYSTSTKIRSIFSTTTTNSEIDKLICSDGEDESFCSNLMSFDCYNYKNQCCHSCKKYFFNQPNCDFGDRVPWCASYVKGEVECLRPEVASLCCKTCHTHSKISTPKIPPSTPNHDSSTSCTNKREEDYCSALKSFDCYKNNEVCCNSCLKFKLQQPNCPFGDKVPWCSSYVKGLDECLRPEVADFCCKTCQDIKKPISINI